MVLEAYELILRRRGQKDSAEELHRLRESHGDMGLEEFERERKMRSQLVWPRITFGEGEEFFPYAPKPTLQFLETAIREEADKLERRPFTRMTVETWERRINIAKTYWGDPVISMRETGLRLGVPPNTVHAKLLELVGGLWLNCTNETRLAIEEVYPRSFSAFYTLVPNLPVGKR